MPAASSGAGPASVAAPIAPAADDLTRIRAINPALRAQLLKLGVIRYRDIAAWTPADVTRISTALNLSGRIEQENWIEQAQILARGGETEFSRRMSRGETATSTPTPNLGQPKPVMAPAPAPVQVAATAAPVVAAATRAVGPQVESRAAFAQQPKASVPAQPAVPAPIVQKPSNVPAAAPPVASAPVAAAPQGLAAAAASAAAAGLGAASGLGRDNLQRISGINAEVEKLLNVQGVSRYGQIAGWAPADVTKIDRMLGQDGRVRKESWIEQAAMLARGGDTAYSRQFDQRAAAISPAPAAVDQLRTSRLADAIRDTAAKAVPDPQVPARGSDMSTLRSVRSEAYATTPAKTGNADDLKRIRGVGVLIEKKLVSMGISTYAQIANWSGTDIDRVSHVLDFKGRIERENWVEQARILSAGGQTEFSRRVDRGEVETSKGS
jgi:predicted flap endonuclease-1-like 5' DNA nuclease